jgi:hypothetical protein
LGPHFPEATLRIQQATHRQSVTTLINPGKPAGRSNTVGCSKTVGPDVLAKGPDIFWLIYESTARIFEFAGYMMHTHILSHHGVENAWEDKGLGFRNLGQR